MRSPQALRAHGACHIASDFAGIRFLPGDVGASWRHWDIAAFQPDRLFPFFLLIWRRWAWGDGALWELAWIYNGLSCLLLGWTGKGVSGPRGKSDH